MIWDHLQNAVLEHDDRGGMWVGGGMWGMGGGWEWGECYIVMTIKQDGREYYSHI